MGELNTFQITRDEFLNLGYELLFLIESHKSVCRWLGPYEEDDASCYTSQMYREKFEGKLSSLLISIASNLRIMQDRGTIGGDLVGSYPKGENYAPEDSQVFQAGVGEMLDTNTDTWKPLVSLRDLANTIMHSEKIDFGVSVLESIELPWEEERQVLGFNNIVVVSSPLGKKGAKHIRMNLRNFSRYLFDIVEELGAQPGR